MEIKKLKAIMKINELKKILAQKDRQFSNEYYKDDLAFGISRLVSNLRTAEGITQIKLSKIIKTTQSGVSRIEKGSALPSLSLLKRIADALGYKIRISFSSKKSQMIFDTEGEILRVPNRWIQIDELNRKETSVGGVYYDSLNIKA